MPRYLLDTNVLSRLARGIDAQISDQVALHLEDCVLSSVAWYELEFGVVRSTNPAKSAQRLSLLRSFFPSVSPFGEEEASESARVRLSLETLKPNAQPIGHYDLLLAGHALALGAVFVTHNVREFSRIPRLVVEDWQASG